MEHGKRLFRETGNVYPSTLSRERAAQLAQSTGGIILRESQSQPGSIAITVIKHRGNVEHHLLDDYIKNNLLNLSSKENAIASLEKLFYPNKLSSEVAKCLFREAGFVHPSTLSREQAGQLAQTTGGIILRESQSQPGSIAITVVNSTGKIEHHLLDDYIKKYRLDLSNKETALASLERLFHPNKLYSPQPQSSNEYRQRMEGLRQESNSNKPNQNEPEPVNEQRQGPFNYRK